MYMLHLDAKRVASERYDATESVHNARRAKKTGIYARDMRWLR